MWKVVIADDEGVILQGLKKLIDWKNLDIELVGEARDGQQLKRVIEDTVPDIVITDIKMPYMTGLDILRWCNEAHVCMRSLFLSVDIRSLHMQKKPCRAELWIIC